MDADGIARSVAAWGRMWERLPRWRGVPCQQFPSDLWRYAELVWELRPPWVLEVGTADGGTAMFLADAMAAAGCDGPVIGVDARPRAVSHPGVTLIEGDSADPSVTARVAGLAGGARGLVLLDGDHSPAQVLAELAAYAPLASYLIVEDTLTEHLPQYADGPRDALGEWLPAHPEWAAEAEPDPSNHPGGWLRRVSG